MKTRKKRNCNLRNKTKKIKFRKAICVLHENKNNIKGFITFSQKNGEKKVKINYNISGLKNGFHGFHVHQYGDLTDGCNSSCAHFNPYNEVHGGLKSHHRHVGDLGNIFSKNKKAIGSFYDKKISLDFKRKNCIIGRCIVVHEDEDDLGKGGNDESLKTGNAGKRLACGVIGISNS